MLDLTQTRSALIGTRFAAHLHHFPTIDSTSTRLLADAAAGAPEGTVYLADEQTAGRGRSNHTWHSAAPDPQDAPDTHAGLYISILAKPSLHLRDALCISLATGLAARAAILSAVDLPEDLKPDVRWPNDLLLRDADGQPARKFGGILVETASSPPAESGTEANLRYAVIGIGINLNQTSFPPELATLATSLRIATGHPISRQPLLIALLRALDFELTQLEAPHATHPGLLTRFAAASTWVRGKRVSVPEQGGYTGTTAGLDPRGFLLVASDDGHLRTVLSGGVRAL